MELSDRTYEHLIERVVDALAHRFAATFERAEVEAVVQQGRAQMESTGHHPEFVPALLEHWARDVLTARAEERGLDARPVPEILFVCEHNAGRSQLAAALADHLGGEHVHVRSAGLHPSGRVNPAVVEVLAERGIRLRRGYTSPLQEDCLDAADVVVLMGVPECEESGRRQVSWDVADPQGQPVEVVREIADQVEERVRGLLAELEVPIVRYEDRHEQVALPV